jgi:hypothetical protein
MKFTICLLGLFIANTQAVRIIALKKKTSGLLDNFDLNKESEDFN